MLIVRTALLLVFLVSSMGMGKSVASENDDTQAGSFVLRGEGSVKAAPDILELYAVIEFLASPGQDPWGRFETAVEDLYVRVSGHGVQRSDFAVFYIEAGTREHVAEKENGKVGIFGAVSIKVPVSEENGALVDAIQRGTDVRVEELHYRRSDEKELVEQARRLAIQNALKQAESVTKSSDLVVGRVLRIGPEPVLPEPMVRMPGLSLNVALGGGVDSVPLEAGELEFVERVEVVVELLPAP